MKTFIEYLNESVNAKVEVNVEFPSKTERDKFLKLCNKEGFSVEFGKNKYAETATLSGEKGKVVKFLKSLSYAEEEMIIKK